MLISKEFILCVIFTIFGTGTAVIPHIMMNTESKGEISESPHYFKKPHFISLLQFLGTSLVIFLFFIKTIAYKYDSNYPVSTHQSFWSFVLKVTSISVFEVVSTSLMFVSLTCMSLSMWQVLRGTVKIFDFLLMKMFYKKRTVAYQLCGVILTAIGMSAILVEYFISGAAQPEVW